MFCCDDQTFSIPDEQGIRHKMLIEEFIIMYLYADVDAGNVNDGTDISSTCTVHTNTTFISIKMYKYL